MTDKQFTTIEEFAEHFRLRIRRDECNDEIIPGKHGGQLYFDGPELCLMAIDAPYQLESRWYALGGKTCWTGSVDKRGKGRIQDVKITGIPPGSYRAAIRMAGVRPIRQFSEEHKAKLAKTAFKPHAESV